ncbi:MAG: hypothetical protein J0J14_18205, partial [Hyphomicrobium sp.]|nr:hypothetical protein [Hyphomicrobium sp.]
MAALGPHGKARACRGGAEPLAYGEGLVAAARELVPGGFDAIVDFAGGSSLDSASELLAPGGAVVSIADQRAR